MCSWLVIAMMSLFVKFSKQVRFKLVILLICLESATICRSPLTVIFAQQVRSREKTLSPNLLSTIASFLSVSSFLFLNLIQTLPRPNFGKLFKQSEVRLKGRQAKRKDCPLSLIFEASMTNSNARQFDLERYVLNNLLYCLQQREILERVFWLQRSKISSQQLSGSSFMLPIPHTCLSDKTQSSNNTLKILFLFIITSSFKAGKILIVSILTRKERKSKSPSKSVFFHGFLSCFCVGLVFRVLVIGYHGNCLVVSSSCLTCKSLVD